MARLIRHTDTGPVELKPCEKSQWVYACGLSQGMPLCDGSHKKARQEDASKLHVYNADRTEVVEACDDK